MFMLVKLANVIVIIISLMVQEKLQFIIINSFIHFYELNNKKELIILNFKNNKKIK